MVNGYRIKFKRVRKAINATMYTIDDVKYLQEYQQKSEKNESEPDVSNHSFIGVDPGMNI